MDSLIYNRQKNIELDIPGKISIIGAGGVGSWIAIYSAMSGVSNISIFDNDIIEIHNLNRIPLFTGDIGKYKVNKLKEYLIKIRPSITVFGYKFRISNDNSDILKDMNVVFDCTDSSKSHKIVEKIWNDFNFKFNLIRASYDGIHFTVAKNYDLEKIAWGKDISGYQVVPSWVNPTSFVAGLATFLAYYKKAPEVYLLSKSMNDLLIEMNDGITYYHRSEK